jgi:glycosyltransferase involved in cell wall biosynthesis
VLLVSDFYPPAPGGLEAHVRRLGHGLVRAGHDVEVVAGGPADPGAAPRDDDGIPVHRGGTSVGRLPGAYQQADRPFHPPWPDREFQRRISQVAGSFGPDVVHAHGWSEFSAAAVCRRRHPLVVTLHDYGLRCPKKNLLRGEHECTSGRGMRCVTCPGGEQGAAKRAILSTALGRTVPRLDGRVALFLAVSEHVAARHRETRLQASVEVIPNFLDLPAGEFQAPAGTGILYVGPADRHKGLSVLLAARARLPAALAPLVVVGAGAGTAAGTGTAGVEFAGRLTGDALWQRYQAAAIVVVPSIWPEPCPTVVLEALASGRPVVGSRTGGIPDLVEHGRTGLLVPPDDPVALAAAIAELLGDRDRLRAMARAAWQSARSFDTTAVVARIESTYGKVLAEWSPR